MKASLCDDCRKPCAASLRAVIGGKDLDFCGYGCLAAWAQQQTGIKAGKQVASTLKGVWRGLR